MRTLRPIQPGPIYHITVRANHKEKYLESPAAKELFTGITETSMRRMSKTYRTLRLKCANI